ncbi:zinc finger protein 397-like isoform X2 [Pseudonaja textilis]|uniref:zinc finger protein 397-like isoform X2 n=1 Tax=Pseudonaja textilis TaxID=8673 RepID=UPI000EA94A75|nr:zinc finger protein 397-like isoform X2 [Pseudonaja textilis]
MATELRPGGAAFLSFQNVLGHGVNPARKSEEEAQVRSLEADGERMVPRVIQVGSIGEFLGWVAPQEMVQGSEEGLAQRWETQWQEVLKTVQLLPPGFGTSHQSNSCELLPNINQGLNGDSSVPQFLVVNNGEFPPRILYGPEVEGNSLMKDVLVDQGALLTEALRQRFRQYSYQEAEEPEEVCKRLQEFCHQWLMPEKHSKEQILELVILEQFLAILPPEMQCWVRDRCPQACSQAVSLAEEFLRSQKQEIKVLEPCTAVVMISPEAEGSLATSGSNSLLCGEAELKDGQDPSSAEEAQHLDVYAVSTGDPAISRNPLGGASQPGDPELPMLFGSLMGQPGSLEGRDGLVKTNPPEPIQKGDGARLCSEGVYETVVRLEEHGHWCLECGESFQDALQLRNHQNSHSGRKRPKCPECGKSFRDLSHVLRHQTVHTGEKPYACFQCGQSFTQKPALNRHLRKHLESQNDSGFIPSMKHPRTDMGSRKRPECLACGKSFRDVSQVLRHQTVHTGERPYSCLECGQSFTQKPALNRHTRKHLKGETYKGDQEQHGNQENSHRVGATSSWAWPNQTFPENRVGPFAGSLGQRPSMNQPPKAASGTDQEGKTARKTISRRGQKRYWCFVCIKGFRDKADLVRHDRIHTGEKPYTCPDCGRKFSYTSSLYKHQLIHRRAASLKGNQFRQMTVDYDPDGFSASRAAPLACFEGGGGWRNGVKLLATEVKPPMEALSVGKADTQSNQFREMTIDYDPDGFSASPPLACLEGGGRWRNGVKLEATEEKPPMEALLVGKADIQSNDFTFDISVT